MQGLSQEERDLIQSHIDKHDQCVFRRVNDYRESGIQPRPMFAYRRTQPVLLPGTGVVPGESGIVEVDASGMIIVSAADPDAMSKISTVWLRGVKNRHPGAARMVGPFWGPDAVSDAIKASEGERIPDPEELRARHESENIALKRRLAEMEAKYEKVTAAGSNAKTAK